MGNGPASMCLLESSMLPFALNEQLPRYLR